MYSNSGKVLVARVDISKLKIILKSAFMLAIVINKKVIETKPSFLFL